MLPRFRYWCAKLILSILVLALIGGCSSIQIGAVLGKSATPTADPTLLAVSAMLTQTAAAPAPAPSATPTPAPAAAAAVRQGAPIPQTGSRELPAIPGEQVRSGPYALIVLPAKLINALGTQKPSQGRAYLDVEVILENISSKPVPYSALFFHLEEAAQAQANQQPLPLNNSKTPALLSGDLAPGDVVRGYLFFDVPAAGGSYHINLNPRGDQLSAVWVDLSQSAVTSLLPEPASPDGLPGLGKRIEQSGEALTVQSITARQTYGRNKPTSGDLFVELDITIENVRLTSVSYNSDYLRIKDSRGYEYPPTVIPDEPSLLAGSLTRGRQIDGHVIFEIPADVHRLVVSYQPFVIGQTLQPIKVQVELPAIH